MYQPIKFLIIRRSLFSIPLCSFAGSYVYHRQLQISPSLRRIKYYQGESLGADFDRAIALEDEELKKLGRDPANILQRNRKVQPLVPKRATTKQMQQLKSKIDKYKDVHFPKEKPFKKSKPKQLELPLPELKFDNIRIPEPLTKSPEDIAMEQRFNELLKKSQEEKIKNENSGIGYLVGGSKVYD